MKLLYSVVILREYLDIINISWIERKLPKMWKASIIVPIVKPEKSPKECKNYKPMPLQASFAKLWKELFITE